MGSLTPDPLRDGISKREQVRLRLRSDMIDYWADQPIEVPSSPDQVAAVAERNELRRQASTLRERDRLAAELRPLVERRGLDSDAVAEAMPTVPALDVRDAEGTVDTEKFGHLLDALTPRPKLPREPIRQCPATMSERWRLQGRAARRHAGWW